MSEASEVIRGDGYAVAPDLDSIGEGYGFRKLRKELREGGAARVSAETVRRVRNLSDSEGAVYLVAGGKDGYVGRDGRLPEGETSPRGSGLPGR